jgi:hypothetical protein
MNYDIISAIADENNYYSIIATVEVIGSGSNSPTGSIEVFLPPVLATPQGWSNTVLSASNSAYENELIRRYQHLWTTEIIESYKANNTNILLTTIYPTGLSITDEEINNILNNL